MPLAPWPIESEEKLADTRIFSLREVRARSPRTGVVRQMARVECVDWVNMVALTSDRQVVLVRQWRHGTREFTLEIPGGMVGSDESPEEAAARELLEETGYAGEGPVRIGTVTPNPAFLTNRCHTYLFTGCTRVAEPELDQGEDIEVDVRPLAEVPGLIAGGGIGHALVICGFWWLAQHDPRGFRPDPAI
jgi:8-oxo-dGTP pyrophosphatase MutT (NUDIX family)